MNKKWVVIFAIAICAAAGWWYWNARPANVQAAISAVRDGSNVDHVMPVEAISEGGVSMVGRSISIVNARVTDVTGPRTLWVAGSEGAPLLVVIAPDRDVVKLASGDRVSLGGVVRDGTSKFSLAAEDQAQITKATLYVLATDVRQIR